MIYETGPILFQDTKRRHPAHSPGNAGRTNDRSFTFIETDPVPKETPAFHSGAGGNVDISSHRHGATGGLFYARNEAVVVPKLDGMPIQRLVQTIASSSPEQANARKRMRSPSSPTVQAR